MLGGGWRHPGLLAAAAEWALENNIDRLTEDHHNASLLSAGLCELGFELSQKVETNFVWASSEALGVTFDELQSAMAKRYGEAW